MRKPRGKKKDPAAVALGRRGGRAGTEAQNRARKANAQRAGRPRRICVRCLQPVRGGHLDPGLDLSCGVHGWKWDRAGQQHPAPPNPALAALSALVAALEGNAGDVPKALALARGVLTGSTV